MPASPAADMAALRQRFPRPTPAAAAYQAFSIVGMNAYLLYLVLTNESSPVAIGLYAVLELIVLSIVSNLALVGVPKPLRVGSPDMPLVSRVFAIVVISAVLFGIFWFSVADDRVHIDQLRQMRNPLDTLRELNVLRPLMVTTGLVVLGALGDRLRWSRQGGPYVSGSVMSAASKFVAAIAGPITAAVASSHFGGGDPVRTAIAWCVVYLLVKSAIELLMLFWQYLGMPEAKDKR